MKKLGLTAILAGALLAGGCMTSNYGYQATPQEQAAREEARLREGHESAERFKQFFGGVLMPLAANSPQLTRPQRNLAASMANNYQNQADRNAMIAAAQAAQTQPNQTNIYVINRAVQARQIRTTKKVEIDDALIEQCNQARIDEMNQADKLASRQAYNGENQSFVLAKPNPPSAPVGVVYIIKQGDTLFTVAKKFYGDGNKWEKIAEANKDKLHDFARPSVGLQLVIP